MQVRLAFAIAAHIEPDILILDEVLAVGDASFQRKCMNKLKEIGSSRRRAVILVSHSMAAVRAMCSKALLLEAGRVRASGEVQDVIARYEGQGHRAADGRVDLTDGNNRTRGNLGARLAWAEIRSAVDGSSDHLCIGDTIHVTFACRLEPARVGKSIMFALSLSTADGIPIAYIIDKDSRFEIDAARPDEVVSIALRDVRFYPGLYTLSLWAGSRDSETWDEVRDCVTFEIKPGGLLAQRPLPRHSGLLFLTPEWKRA
jgi:lipopolysaccharide transport system ATP-binding protein